MRYVSIDIETTGLNPETCQILEIGAVIDDTDPEKMLPITGLPKFRALLLHKEWIEGEPFALQMNVELIREIAMFKDPLGRTCVSAKTANQYNVICEPQHVGQVFAEWLAEYGITSKVIAAGKNFASFDRQFLERLPNWDVKFHHRTLDPMMCYMYPDDTEPPKFETCLQRANLDSALQTHRAVDDAIAVCLLIRHAMKFYGSK